MEILVEAAPEIQPTFQRGYNGTFELYVPGIRVKLSTRCNPHPQQYPDLAAFRPYEEFVVALPEVQRVIFDPRANMPPNGRAWCRAQKRGAVIELPEHIKMNAKLKTDSPFGSLILEDISTHGGYSQKTGETTLNYRLQVDGQVFVSPTGGFTSANRLMVELNFTFDCYIGGAAMSQAHSQDHIGRTSQSHVPPCSNQGAEYGGGQATMNAPPQMGQPAGYGWPWSSWS